MFGKLIAYGFAGGGAAAASQAPAYAQQYVQRLGGAVAELERSVAEYEALAARQGQTLEAWIGSMQGNAPVAEMKTAIAGQVARLAQLKADLAALSSGDWSPQALLPHLARFGDLGIQEGTWESFQPGMQFTAAGLMWIGLGAATGLLLAAALRALGGRIFARRRPA